MRLRVEGADSVAVDGDAFRLSTAAGMIAFPLLIVDELPVVGSQVETSGTRIFEVTTPFVSANANRRSALGNQESPTDNPADLLYSTFLGGGADDYTVYVAIDGTGSAYVSGVTLSSSFPTTPGAFDPSYNGGTCRTPPNTYPCHDAFVAKLNPTGSALEYATFLGGSDDDQAFDIAIDEAGNAYVTGVTNSTNFPVTPGAFDTSYNGGTYDGFVAKLNPTGSALGLRHLSGRQWLRR